MVVRRGRVIAEPARTTLLGETVTFRPYASNA
jgi:hypothetical protein